MFYFSWTKGYNGSHADFITSNVICYKTGNTIKFINTDGREILYSAPKDGGIGSLAVHGINGVFAFSEMTVNPKIIIVQFPSLKTVSEIKGEQFFPSFI